MTHRLRALDVMRGLAMVIMATDHASEAFNASRPVTDSALFAGWDGPLDTWQFLFRWPSHICAPVFLFLAGTSLALSIDRRQARGVSAWKIDRDLLVRGLLILAVELFFINVFWIPGTLLLQVMFAIGLSMILMIALRRLPVAALSIFAIGGILLGEWTGSRQIVVPIELIPMTEAFLVSGGWLPVQVAGQTGIMTAYPVIPWCAIMVMGWLLGLHLLRLRRSGDVALAARTLAMVGAACLAVFLVFRGLNGFGNLGLLRVDDSALRWLHVSKYPPSLTFVALELGIMFLLLAWFFRREVSSPPGDRNVLVVFGQTAFFFYLAHILIFEVTARAAGLYLTGNLGHAMLAFLPAVAALYPACLGYRALKTRYPDGVLRYF